MPLAHIVRRLALLFLLIQCAYFALAWLYPVPLHVGSMTMQFAAKGLDFDAARAMLPAQRWIGALCSLPALLTLCYAVWRLDRMLAAFALGRIFAASTIAHLRAFAAAMTATIAFGIVEPLLRGLAWRAAGFASSLQAGVGSEEWMVLLVCALFYVVARMMEEGRRIAEENEGFV